MQVNQNYSLEISVFSVHVMKEMKRERVMTTLSGSEWFFNFFLHFILFFYSFEWRLSNLLPFENQFLKALTWPSNAGLKWETCAWLLANTSHSAEMTLLSSWKYSVHCSSIAIRMCHGGCPVCSIFVAFLLPAWLNGFSINDNWGFILIHTYVCLCNVFISNTLLGEGERNVPHSES